MKLIVNITWKNLLRDVAIGLGVLIGIYAANWLMGLTGGEDFYVP